MRAFSCQLAVLGLLIMGFEGVTDLTVLADSNGDHAHAVAVAHHTPAHGDSGTETDPEHHDHCGHTCHGHLTNVGATAFALTAELAGAHDGLATPILSSWSHAPPTPPPNA